MEKLMNLITHRRFLVVAIFSVLSLAGVYSWKQLAIDAYPDIADVTVQVVTQVSGLAAEEVEQQITIPLERALNGIPKLNIMRSKSTFGLSTVILVFDDDADDYWCRQRVQERIADVELPYGAEPGLNPLTSPIGEIYRYVIEANDNYSLRELTELNKWVIIPRLCQIQGVADVSNYGGVTTQYQVEIDPDKLNMYDISLTDVEDALDRNNANAGGSMLTRGDLSYVVRGVGLIHDLDEMGQIVVKSINGTPIYLKDLGELKYGNLERKGILGYTDATTDRRDGVEGIVQMLRFENPSDVLAQVHSAIDELNQETLPKGVRIVPILDRTNLVHTTLNTVSHTLLFGMLLVIIVLLIYLRNIRSSLLVALTIPVSLLIAFILMYLTNVPANLLSLGAIDFGILVDGTIVMVEMVLKLREEHPGVELRSKDMVSRMVSVAKPIFFSTLIIIVAYLPLFAFQRMERKLFTPMAFTVGYAMLGAMMASLILIPALSYALYRKPHPIRRNLFIERLTERYEQFTARFIHTPKKLIAPIVVMLGAVIALCITIGKDFLPTLDEGGIWIQVQTPYGISIDRSADLADSLRHKLAKFPEVTYVLTQVGRDDVGTEPFTASHIECSVGLKPYGQWNTGRNKAQLVNEMEEVLSKMPGLQVGFSQPIIDMVMDQIAGAHSDLAVKVYGEDQTESRLIADQIVDVVKQIKGATDVMIEQEPPLPQLQIDVDRGKVAQYGLNIADVGDLIEVAIGGKAVSQLYKNDRVFDITCRYKAESRETPEAIGKLMLTNQDGVKIPLNAVTNIRTSLGASTLCREMNHRHLTIRVNLRGRDLSSFLSEAQSKIDKQVKFDHSQFSVSWDGQYANQQRAYSRLMVVVPFILLFMFLLMYGAFNEWRQAGLLLALLPLALLGGLLALTVRDMSFNVSSAVGFIALFGLTIQNGVIMISHINNLRKAGMGLAEATLRGAAHRLRPILMTASVAVLGLLPASLATGIGSDVQRPLATVIVYGLLCSTIITLFILPTLYYTVERKFEKHSVSTNK